MAGHWLPKLSYRVHMVQQLGLTKDDLIPVIMKMNAANESPISILGAIIIRISGVDQQNNVIETKQMTYITKDSDTIFLCKSACIDLGMIPPDFPKIGAATSSDGESINPVTDDQLQIQHVQHLRAQTSPTHERPTVEASY